MKNKLLLIIVFTSLLDFNAFAQDVSVTVFNSILFYDGYAPRVDFDTPEGVIRHRNDLYSRKLSTTEVASFGNDLTINVTIAAACDNYDRIGNVNLAFVPKNDLTYIPSEVQRIELGRFITPFMNKNISPTQVPYTFSVNNVAAIFKDPALLELYDFWVELEVFGVPYAANTQVAGCAGRNDVFYGTLEFVSTTFAPIEGTNYILPLNFKKDLNNYGANATDVPGETTRIINFDLPNAVDGAAFYLITSNHGANQGGEEYIRRYHDVSLDDVLKLRYRPGGASCEPFRVYNTQGNGIYGPTPRTPSQWASFSNWCPGQVIPIRIINLGNLPAGPHSFKLNVLEAEFVDGQGYIPVSVYLQGKSAVLGINENVVSYSVYPNPTADFIDVQSSATPTNIEIFTIDGRAIWQGTNTRIDLSNFSKGVYMMKMNFANSKSVTQKIVKK